MKTLLVILSITIAPLFIYCVKETKANVQNQVPVKPLAKSTLEKKKSNIPFRWQTNGFYGYDASWFCDDLNRGLVGYAKFTGKGC